MSLAQLENELLTYSDGVARNLTVVSKEKSPTPDLYHISMDPSIKVFCPRISDRQMSTEDRTVPRVVTATSLYGCILAYASAHEDYMKMESKQANKDSKWRNGYYIYKLDYQFCLKPTNKLVPDVAFTDETWLVSYSPETKNYPSSRIGKLFITEIKNIIVGDKLPEVDASACVEVLDPAGIQLSKNQRLAQGYWLVELSIWDRESWRNLAWTNDKEIKVKQISKEEYLGYKQRVASLLGLTDEMPAYAVW